jgi:Tfp pilus assembly protein PilZ
MVESRRVERIKVTSIASFFEERAVTAGIIQDLSAYGARVLTETALRVGDTVEVKLELPDDRGTLRALARVAWHKPSTNRFHPHLIGLEFVNIGSDDLALLQAFAAEHHRGTPGGTEHGMEQDSGSGNG